MNENNNFKNCNNNNNTNNSISKTMSVVNKSSVPSSPTPSSSSSSALNASKKEKFKLMKILSSSINSNKSQENNEEPTATTDGAQQTEAATTSEPPMIKKPILVSVNSSPCNSVIQTKKKNKLQHQAMSLSTAIQSIVAASPSITPQIVPHSTITNLLRASHTKATDETSNAKPIVSSSAAEAISSATVQLQSIPKSTLFSTGLLFQRLSPNSGASTATGQSKLGGKSNLKEHLKQKNVRRKSSTINAGCFLSNNLIINSEKQSHSCSSRLSPTPSTKKPANISPKTSISRASSKKQPKANSNNNQLIDPNLMAKAAKRGSIHYYDTASFPVPYTANPISRNSNANIGVLVGVNDTKFRKKLLRLQQKQIEFTTASSSHLTPGFYRRKKAFVVDNTSLYSNNDDDSNYNINNDNKSKTNVEYAYPGSFYSNACNDNDDNYLDADEDDDNYDYDALESSYNDNKIMSMARLSHAISSLVS